MPELPRQEKTHAAEQHLESMRRKNELLWKRHAEIEDLKNAHTASTAACNTCQSCHCLHLWQLRKEQSQCGDGRFLAIHASLKRFLESWEVRKKAKSQHILEVDNPLAQGPNLLPNDGVNCGRKIRSWNLREVKEMHRLVVPANLRISPAFFSKVAPSLHQVFSLLTDQSNTAHSTHDESLLEYVWAMQELYERAGQEAAGTIKVARACRQCHSHFRLYLRGQSFLKLEALAQEARVVQADLLAELAYRLPPRPQESLELGCT